MRCLLRNMTPFEYLPYSGTETDLNNDGEHTGEYHPAYGNPVPYMGTITEPSGRINQTFYGQDIRYTHTLILDNPNAEIREGGIIRWKDDLYDIQAVRPSLNFMTVALRKQTTDDPTQHPVSVVPVTPGGEGE